MLYIESPAGVGFSVNNNTNLTTNDTIQSEDAIAALLDWYSKYEEYKPNKLFVSGESYGGIYVPYLSW
jgi:cathepsin A (carboxypeptidase C)